MTVRKGIQKSQVKFVDSDYPPFWLAILLEDMLEVRVKRREGSGCDRKRVVGMHRAGADAGFPAGQKE
jgi:hypothetical protein